MLDKALTQYLSGICMVPGKIVAPSYLLTAPVENYHTYAHNFDTLREHVIKTLGDDIKIAFEVSTELALILSSYKEVINDSNFKQNIEELSLIGMPLPKAIDEYFEHVMMTLSEYQYLDKKNDIRDIYVRFQTAMYLTPREPISLVHDVILVCQHLTVSDFLFLPLERVKAFVVTTGHRTSHVVELAEQLNIPMVIQMHVDILSLKHPVRLSLNEQVITLI